MNPSPLTNNIYLPDTEYIVFAREKGVRLYGNYHTKRKYYISGVNQADKKKWKHPTIKPLPFIENHIINSSNEGDLILDCFAGSGTTLVGAINENDVVLDCFIGSGTTAVASILENRKFIGFEINKKYYEIAQYRINEALEKKKGENK